MEQFQMQQLTRSHGPAVNGRTASVPLETRKRLGSIDFLRGLVVVIMALDHVRDYFHYDAFFFSPTDLSKTTGALFFTRWITHFCAPVFIFLAGVSACLYGAKKSKKELSWFLLTRGVWLMLVEIFILSLFRTFNPSFTYINLQVIWAIGLSMIALSGAIYLRRNFIVALAILLIAGHNLLDNVHVVNNYFLQFLWAIVHEVKFFTFGNMTVYIHYPVLPWIGVMMLGYYIGGLYAVDFQPAKRRKILLLTGVAAIILFGLVRLTNWYGDPARWSFHQTPFRSFLSFLNVTKYPPSLLYTLITLGPAMILLSAAEKPLPAWTRKINIFGRVPMFFYLAHILLIHVMATIAGIWTGHPQVIRLNASVNDVPALKGYGFSLWTVYLVWFALIIVLYPLCRWYDQYKTTFHSKRWWLSYL